MGAGEVQGVGVDSSTADTELGTGVVERFVEVRALLDIEFDPKLRVLVSTLEPSRERLQGEGDDGRRVEVESLCHPSLDLACIRVGGPGADGDVPRDCRRSALRTVPAL
jgi:hypothetical protein